MFNLKEKALYIILAILVIFMLLAAGSLFNSFLNQDAIDNNVAVAVKAKEDLKNAVEKNNQAQEEIIKLKTEIEDRKKLEQEVKVIEEDNNKIVIQSEEKIKVIDNSKVIYKEKKEDIHKSTIIIDEIWNVYTKGKNNENITNSNK